MSNKIILFDGVCNLCNASVNFIIKHDKKHIFKFASLQSAAGQALLKRFGLDGREFDSVVLIEHDKVYTQSTAALKISKHLSGFLKLLYIFILLPAKLRDFLYDYVADNRYKWFGKKDSCRVPTPELKGKFL